MRVTEDDPDHNPNSETGCPGPGHPRTRLAIPVINLNGSSRELLREAYCEAYRAVMQAHSSVAGTAPHPRDYQTAPAGEYERAREQHVRRLQDLNCIALELSAIYRNVAKEEP